MLDVVIVGGGLCGLALAHSLQAKRRDWVLVEARERLGGRILTARAASGVPLDLGPTWYWPGHQPSITRLIDDLGLPWIEQADDGRVLLLNDPARDPETVAIGSVEGDNLPAPEGATAEGGVHGGARRLVGGMQGLVDALAGRLPADRLRTGQALTRIVDHGDFVELRLSTGDPSAAPVSLTARRVVLAMPPRLLTEQVAFEPALPQPLLQAMNDTPTWMATAAKAAIAYDRPFWRERGLTGNAWVTHSQAMLAEVFDASPDDGRGALAGFMALGVDARRQFAGGMEILLRSQFSMLFGLDAGDGDLHRHDWADETYTASALDREEDATGSGHPAYGDPLLQQAWWEGRLLFGGSETARQGGGYLEGALSAAARLRRELAATEQASAVPSALPAAPAPAHPASDAANEDLLRRYGEWVITLRSDALARYRTRLHQSLSTQDVEQLTQRAVLEALESIYADALAQLEGTPLQTPAAPVVDGRSPLTPPVLAHFSGLADELLGEAVKFNNTSCALSNFPYEHKPPRDYLQTIRRDLAAAWRSFALAANDRLLAKTTGAKREGSAEGAPA